MKMATLDVETVTLHQNVNNIHEAKYLITDKDITSGLVTTINGFLNAIDAQIYLGEYCAQRLIANAGLYVYKVINSLDVGWTLHKREMHQNLYNDEYSQSALYKRVYPTVDDYLKQMEIDEKKITEQIYEVNINSVTLYLLEKKVDYRYEIVVEIEV